MSYDEFKKLCEKSGERIIIVFLLIDLKRGIKENIVFAMKAKTFK